MKSQIRQLNKEKRAAMSESEVAIKSKMASEMFLSSEIYKNCTALMVYFRLGNEIDTKDIVKAAIKDGKKVLFPVTDMERGKITPYYADGSTEFSLGAFSVSEPQNTKKADVKEIDVVLVPGIAFDKSGTRIGFGKGCYDMFLPQTNAIKIGYCYDFQVCEQIPADEHDVSMGYLLTERGLIRCQKSYRE